MLDPHLDGKVALITGANHGIGAATALAFAARSAKVFMAFYRVPCRYSGEALEKARAAGVGGDALYRARQQQSAEPLLQEIRSRGAKREHVRRHACHVVFDAAGMRFLLVPGERARL